MKHIIVGLVAIAFMLLAAPSSADADFDETTWPFLKEIEHPEGVESGYAFFEIDGEIYDGTMGMIHSMRIVDSDGVEVPHQIVTKQQSVKREEFSPKFLNNAYADSLHNSFTLDFGEERPEINRLTIATDSANFTRRVSVEGSDDQAEWNTLVGDAYIFDFSRNIHSRHLSVEFPLSNFRYFRVKIHDDGAGPLEIGGAKAYRIKTEPAETQSWPMTIIDKTENEERNTTEIVLDPGFLGLPITALDLDVSSRNYHRNVKVASSADRDNWAALGTGVIFNFDMPAFKRSGNMLTFRQNGGGRYFMLTIENYDDLPIEVSGATATGLVRRVVLPLTGRAPYKVYFGDPKAKRPRYDLAQRMRYIQTTDLPRLSLRRRQTNPSHVSREPVVPWSERHPSLLWIVMVVVMAALALLIYNLMKKAPPGNTQE